MIRPLVAWLATALTFVVLDMGWLSLMSSRLYKPVIGELMSGKVQAAPAILFYLLYISGLVFFAVWPGVKTGEVGKALIAAIVLGVVAYGTYDLTNQATLRLWAWRLTIADMVWGGFASGAASLAGFYAARLLGG